jgi:hypothetical protein
MSRGRLVATDQSFGQRSPMKTGSGAVGAETGMVRRLSVPVGGRGITGKEVGEEVRCTGTCERKNGETRDGVG